MLSTPRNNGLSTVRFPQVTDWPETDSDAPLVKNPVNDCPISALLSHAREGDRQVVGELLQTYRNYLLLLATGQIGRRLQSRLSASDLVQEVMLKAHRHFAQFKGRTERELLAWLRQILLSSLAHFLEKHMLAAKRDARREVSIESFEANAADNGAPMSAALRPDVKTPSVYAQDREEALLLASRLAQLPSQYREILVLRNIQGMSFEEAAARMDRSLGATRMLWLRAIEKLRALYQRADSNA
jgi:RNA polymerase sigma-70 factor, ECF subfamily